MANSEEFIKFCAFLERYYIHDIIKCMFYCFNVWILISIFSRKGIKAMKTNLIIISVSIISWLIKRNFAIIGSVIETIILFGFPLFISNERKLKIFICSLLGCLIVNILQLISLFVRNINPIIIKENFLIGLIMQIDYYIMLILYYLYYVKMKGRINMDWGVFWFADKEAMDKGYLRFIKVMSTLGIILTFPVSVPYLIWKNHKRNKMIKVKN